VLVLVIVLVLGTSGDVVREIRISTPEHEHEHEHEHEMGTEGPTLPLVTAR